mmetsp:Transcript_598/g.1892  ORF Transcript_598/g.1892 Transcript_598/m.1892 type:complete len:221 (-) Transcript_598:181-843(-)
MNSRFAWMEDCFSWASLRNVAIFSTARMPVKMDATAGLNLHLAESILTQKLGLATMGSSVVIHLTPHRATSRLSKGVRMCRSTSISACCGDILSPLAYISSKAAMVAVIVSALMTWFGFRALFLATSPRTEMIFFTCGLRPSLAVGVGVRMEGRRPPPGESEPLFMSTVNLEEERRRPRTRAASLRAWIGLFGMMSSTSASVSRSIWDGVETPLARILSS